MADEELKDALDQIDILRSLLVHSDASREESRLALQVARDRERADLRGLLRDMEALVDGARRDADYADKVTELVTLYFERRLRSLTPQQ